jgi:hypothetical protein
MRLHVPTPALSVPLIVLSLTGCFDETSEVAALTTSSGATAGTTSGDGTATEGADTDTGTSGGTATAGGSSGTTSDTTSATGSATDTDEPPIDVAEFRFVHAASSVGAVDLYRAGETTPFAAGVEFGDTTPWSGAPSVSFGFEVRPAGASPMSTAVLFGTLTADEGGRATGVVAGELDGDADTDLRVVPVVEAWGNDVAGRTRVRFVHAGLDAPTVTFAGAGSGDAVVERFATSPAEGASVDAAGGVTLDVRGPDGMQEVTSFTTPQLAEGDDVLLIATGLVGQLAREADGFQLLAVGSEGPLEPIRQDPELFIVHASRDAQSLEVCTGTQELAANANFVYGEIAVRRVAPGPYTLELFDYPAGCTGQALNGDGNATGPLEAGERYMLLVTGERTADAGEASIQVAPFQDTFTLGDTANANVRFIHGASYTQIFVGAVTAGLMEAENIYTDAIVWRAESRETAIPAGQLELGIADAVGEPPLPYTPIVTFDVAAVGGARQWGIIAGDPTPDDADDGFLQLVTVDTTVPGWAVAFTEINP